MLACLDACMHERALEGDQAAASHLQAGVCVCVCRAVVCTHRKMWACALYDMYACVSRSRTQPGAQWLRCLPCMTCMRACPVHAHSQRHSGSGVCVCLGGGITLTTACPAPWCPLGTLFICCYSLLGAHSLVRQAPVRLPSPSITPVYCCVGTRPLAVPRHQVRAVQVQCVHGLCCSAPTPLSLCKHGCVRPCMTHVQTSWPHPAWLDLCMSQHQATAT